MTEIHPTWGRPIEQYVHSFTLDALKQELHSTVVTTTQNANLTLFNQRLAAIHSISDIGREGSSEKVTRMASEITLQTLRDVLDIIWYKVSVSFLTEPDLVRGCIKLMTNFNPNGNKSTSPFSYEYGYLCFRIATIALDLCLTQTEPLLNPIIDASRLDLRNGRLHTFELIARVAADFVYRQLSPPRIDITVKEGDMIIPFQEAQSLLDIMWTDRDLFLRVLLQSYTPGVTGVMYLLWQMWRVGRQRSIENDLRLGVPLFELLWRNCMGMTQDEALASSMLVNDMHSSKGSESWLDRSRPLDKKDSRTLIHGYVRRIATTATWNYRPHLFSVPAILEVVTALSYPGSENATSLFAATICFLWGEVDIKEHLEGGDIHDIAVIFNYLSQFLKNIPKTAHSTMQTLVRDFIDNELISLVARLIVLQRSPMDQSDEESDKTRQFFWEVANFFQTISSKIPRNIILGIFTKNTGEQTRFLDYMIWCSEILGSSDANREYCKAGGALWFQMMRALRPGAEIPPLSHPSIRCSYTRCPGPKLIPAMIFVCSERGAAYCGFRCQTLDRKYECGGRA